MKYALLSYKENGNRGDEIQSLAAAQFLPQINHYVDREYLNEYTGEDEAKLLLNGWFMGRPQNWPPHEKIHPLFISFHINDERDADKILLREEFIEYYKQHEPIGCRDYNTVSLFEAVGVKAYFTGCLTLTLQNRFARRNDSILCVDPLYKTPPQAKREYLFHLIPPGVRNKVTFVRQFGPKNISIATKFQQAKQLIDLYSQAKLVLTSRIHCALPCLALGTPVIFLHSDLDLSTDSARLGGLLELMRVFDLHELKSGIDVPAGFYADAGAAHEKAIDWDNPAPNPVDISPIADQLRKTCQDFING